jgi:2,4-diketo-3-deoxy-L-fuconate hydrolase
MRLIRFGRPGLEKPGILIAGQRRDVSSRFPDFDRRFFESDGLAELGRALAGGDHEFSVVPEHERWAPCVARPGKVICVGLNYKDHAAESGVELPREPVLFMKASNTVVGAYDTVLIPRGSTKTDWEVELGIVIGKEARYLASEADAAAHIAGYTVSHDVSEREFQLERGGQWTKGKSCDTFNPLGPALVTPDEAGIVTALALSLRVNGAARQSGNTRNMAFGPHALVHYISQFMTLEPGDLINTGTPGGVGLGMKPPQYLKPGDVVELEIEGLGTQRQTVGSA